MPNEGQDTVHVTPIFSKNTYKVEVSSTPEHIQMTVSNKTPKAREEVTVELLCDQGYIPKDFTITGCDGTWWLVDKPEKQSNGKWKVVYRFKVGLQNVSMLVNHRTHQDVYPRGDSRFPGLGTQRTERARGVYDA